MPDPTLDAAIDSLARVKAEHRPILAQIAGDPGMAPDTRASLIEHLYAEEDEHVAEIQGLLGAGSGASPGSTPPPSPTSSSQDADSVRRGLTVGSLRAEPAPIRPPRASASGLAARGSNSLSVGSLRT